MTICSTPMVQLYPVKFGISILRVGDAGLQLVIGNAGLILSQENLELGSKVPLQG